MSPTYLRLTIKNENDNESKAVLERYASFDSEQIYLIQRFQFFYHVFFTM